MYYLKLSGFIPEGKQLEFEQTYRLASFHIPKSCGSYSITKDALNEGIFHFTSYWSCLTHLKDFSNSATFLMLTGAFKALGELHVNERGEITPNVN
jgi:hypothetical protein